MLLAGIILASAVSAGAFAVSEGTQSVTEIAVSSPVPVELLGEDAVFAFRPEANSVYGVYLFAPEDSAAWLSARLYRATGRQIAVGSAAEGAPCALTARLTAGERYTLVVSGAGRATMEIARETLGRCYDNPIRLDASGSYAKLIARAGDSHWYAFQAEDSVPATVGIVPEKDGLHTNAVLLNGSGKLLASSLALDEGACVVYARLTEGDTYYLRVEGGEAETGGYRLQVLFDARDASAPTEIHLDADALELENGGRRLLRASLEPAEAAETILWRSSDSTVAVVTAAGEVIAVGPGEAAVTATGFGGVQAVCAVTVQGVPMTGVRFAERELTLRVGETQRLAYSFEPVGAYTRDVTFAVADETLAAVDAGGALKALAEGTTEVTLSADDGAFADILSVTVTAAAPRCRALLVGEQLYRKDVNKVRTGAINTVENLNAMLGTYTLNDQTYEATMLLDVSAAETVQGIARAFAGAAPQDVSLFYITCHGYYQGGMSYLQFYDGSLLSAADLEHALRRVPGTVAVLIDCCGSGGFLGRASAPEDFNRGVVAAFSGRVGPGVLTGSKYKVLTSALLDEDSYRISFDENLTEGSMATVFARALADGAGWNITRGRRAAMRADLDMDRGLSLQELYQYTARRVTWYLRLAGGGRAAYRQNVQIWPAGDPFTLFGREAN